MRKYNIKFGSNIPDYTDKYKFKIELTADKANTITVSSTMLVTDFYDEKGYLHRYKVRDFLNDNIKD